MGRHWLLRGVRGFIGLERKSEIEQDCRREKLLKTAGSNFPHHRKLASMNDRKRKHSPPLPRAVGDTQVVVLAVARVPPCSEVRRQSKTQC